MARLKSRTYQTAQEAHVKVMAARQALLAEEEPMHRYSHPISQPAPCATAPVLEASGEVWTQVLEQLSCQSQLLVDLLGAVNALTAALLCRQQQSS
ncbi:hypothetical protein [Vermiculatibacterium agrestimuris]|jgi:hypothetical protein|uniref:hypothetical protein n=1 Tax=Vermiculatibacterium agrestimuris TaxID=2941519 RepID=UPI00203A676F|nr:hypothetical protein [Vermiculatibacterium agrestimuris]